MVAGTPLREAHSLGDLRDRRGLEAEHGHDPVAREIGDGAKLLVRGDVERLGKIIGWHAPNGQRFLTITQGVLLGFRNRLSNLGRSRTPDRIASSGVIPPGTRPHRAGGPSTRSVHEPFPLVDAPVTTPDGHGHAMIVVEHDRPRATGPGSTSGQQGGIRHDPAYRRQRRAQQRAASAQYGRAQRFRGPGPHGDPGGQFGAYGRQQPVGQFGVGAAEDEAVRVDEFHGGCEGEAQGASGAVEGPQGGRVSGGRPLGQQGDRVAVPRETAPGKAGFAQYGRLARVLLQAAAGTAGAAGAVRLDGDVAEFAGEAAGSRNNRPSMIRAAPIPVSAETCTRVSAGRSALQYSASAPRLASFSGSGTVSWSGQW